MKVSLDRLNKLSDETPVLVNLKPVGNGYMEDFCAAGGMGALLRELKPLLHLDCMTVTGETLGERLEDDDTAMSIARSSPQRDKPLEAEGGLVALFGNLAPKGAILKRSAADAKLFEHEGRAVVFASLEDLAARIDDPALDVEANDILVLQNAGPHAPACMPEAGYLPIPKKLAQHGRQGHDPHFRRAHERHRLRHHRAACDAGCRLRRPARPRAHRRPHQAVGEAAQHRIAGR